MQAHSLIRTNKLYGLTVIIVGFSITRTRRGGKKGRKKLIRLHMLTFHTRPSTEPVLALEQCTFAATRGQRCPPFVSPAAEKKTSLRASSSKNRKKSADFWSQLGVGSDLPTKMLLSYRENPDYYFFFIFPPIAKMTVNLPEIVQINRFEHKQAPPTPTSSPATLDAPPSPENAQTRR